MFVEYGIALRVLRLKLLECCDGTRSAACAINDPTSLDTVFLCDIDRNQVWTVMQIGVGNACRQSRLFKASRSFGCHKVQRQTDSSTQQHPHQNLPMKCKSRHEFHLLAFCPESNPRRDDRLRDDLRGRQLVIASVPATSERHPTVARTCQVTRIITYGI